MDAKICIVENCINKYFCKRYCSTHYKQMYNYGRIIITQKGRKVCGYERKNTKISITSPNIKDIAWAAGFCEGEASFQYSLSSKSSKVTLPQVELEPVQKMLSLFGGAICTRKETNRANSINIWHISGSRARGFMMTIYSFMSKKRKKQIKKALNLVDTLDFVV